jgi:rhodanese-related sulfurtransferase
MSSGLPEPEIAARDVPADALLLDVREPDEWLAGHVPGAMHIPIGQIRMRAAEVPQDQVVYVICRTGARSGVVTRALSGAGWQLINVAGGMQDWAAAGRPMVSELGADPVVA